MSISARPSRQPLVPQSAQSVADAAPAVPALPSMAAAHVAHAASHAAAAAAAAAARSPSVSSASTRPPAPAAGLSRQQTPASATLPASTSRAIDRRALLGRTFRLTELSPSFERRSAVCLSITHADVSLAPDPTELPPEAVSWTRLDSIEHITFIDIGLVMGERDDSLATAVQFNTGRGVHLFLCVSFEQKAALTQYWNSLMAFVELARSNNAIMSYNAFDSDDDDDGDDEGSDSEASLRHRGAESARSGTPSSMTPMAAAAAESGALGSVAQKMQDFSRLSDAYKGKLTLMESALRDKTAELQRVTKQFQDIEAKNMSLLRQLSEAQSKNLDVLERFRRLEQVHLASSEKMTTLQQRLEDRMSTLDEKQELLKVLEQRLHRTRTKSRGTSFLVYFISLPILAAILAHYLLLLNGAYGSHQAPSP